MCSCLRLKTRCKLASDVTYKMLPGVQFSQKECLCMRKSALQQDGVKKLYFNILIRNLLHRYGNPGHRTAKS